MTATTAEAYCTDRSAHGQQTRWQQLLPEVLMGLVVAVGTAGEGNQHGLWPWGAAWVLYLGLCLRMALFAAIAVHGLGHALAVSGPTWSTLARYLGRLPLRGLLPFGPLFVPGLSKPAQAPRLFLAAASSRRRRMAALAGPLANALLLAALVPMLTPLAATGGAPGGWQAALPLLAAANLWVVLTSWSDYRLLFTGRGRRLFCGNFGILAKRGPRERGFLPKRFRHLVVRLGQATELRGQQAGGLAVLGSGGRFVGRKIVNGKRGDLTRDLLAAFRRRALVRRLGGAKPMQPLFHLVGHYRYGTSSHPSELETHWHRWLRPRVAGVWCPDGRHLVRRRQWVEQLITHNGDFDAWAAPWGRLDNAELGQWLTRVLEQPHRARGDSPKIAGMMDLLLTEGRWDASLRFAYAMQTGIALPRPTLKALTAVFERVFARWAGPRDAADADQGTPPVVVGCTSLAEVFARNPSAIQCLVDALRQACLAESRDWPEAAKRQRQRIVGRAVHAFFHNDLYLATALFMERAQGTFGLVTTTSLQPGAVALATERQPLSIGADPDAGLLLYASETAALKLACLKGANGQPMPLPYRYDLQDGDLALLQVREGTADNSFTLMNRHTQGAPVTTRLTAKTLAEGARDRARPGWISLRDNPCIEPTAAPRRDRVLAEMRDIPPVLDRIQRDWADPAAANRRTARAFSDALLQSARGCANAETAPTAATAATGNRPRLNATLDLLVLGVENSRYLAERFVEDLRRVLPYVHAQAVDAVSFCEAPQRYALGPESITLAVSHSGQTFNSLDAVKFIQQLHGFGKTGPVFVMTGEIDTLMGAAVGQGIQADDAWVARVFATGAGWRSAEPATVSTAAAHATLTQLLIRIARDLHSSAQGAFRPFGLAASAEDLDKLEALSQQTVKRAEALFGRTAEGWEIETAERTQLQREGRYLARLLVEPALVFVITAMHLFAMLWLGWNPVIGAGQLLHDATGWPVFAVAHPLGQVVMAAWQTAYFLFAAALFTLGLRLLQRRPLWDRVFVGRTLVIGDLGYVKDLLGQYVSKLFSLSYEFAGFAGIHAADTRSGELLHGYGHRITRGLVLYLGLPDGRLPGRERAEAAVCMTCSQARGVRNMGAGALVYGVGHNAASASRVDRFIPLASAIDDPDAVPRALRGSWSALARDLQGSRFAAFERLLAGYLLFHTTAARTRDVVNRLVPLANLVWSPVFWTLRIVSLGRLRPRFGVWDISRTQSGTRIATTAAPVPAIAHDPLDYLTPWEQGAVSAPDWLGQLTAATAKPAMASTVAKPA
jgi:hypothetical protein